MPNLTFVLPHWLYWSGLIIFPLVAMFIIKRNAENNNTNDNTQNISTSLAYFLLITAGFLGIHRFYVRSRWGYVFIPLFIGLLLANVEIRDGQNTISNAKNEIVSAEFLIKRFSKQIEDGEEGAEQKLESAKEQLVVAKQLNIDANENFSKWNLIVRILAISILVLIIVDAFLLPKLLARCRELEKGEENKASGFACPIEPSVHSASLNVDSRMTRWIDKTNEFAGNFIAYWSAIAVIVYYYEVIARYVFNSPTNWAHESMFLMFGAQYLLAGGYALREDAHVRVDVIYMHFSDRMKALVDVITSIFFFIFVCTLLWTGWIFFYDSFSVFEVSFTEWAIQYWPIKLSLPLGAALLLLQGLSRLAKDIMILKNGINSTENSGANNHGY